MAKSIPVIVETSRGSRDKFAFDFETGLLRLTKVLPEGFVFPLNFGSIPGTRADDGDPLDILMFMADPVPAGTLVMARPIGVLEAKQTEDGETERNDRLLGVAVESPEHEHVKSIRDVGKQTLRQYEVFFEAYNEQCGKKFHPLGWFGPARAWKLIERTRKRYRPIKPKPLPASFAAYAELGDED
jgi:inorganic pyrophosphatase